LLGMHLRLTEYTVGPTGPQAMPGSLPPASEYTYAIALRVDEAVAAGAARVSFDKPLAFYVEDFTGFPVGQPVPTGYYDASAGAWVESASGVILRIVALHDGLADIDVDGDGVADSADELATFGITDSERDELGALYQAGQALWRVSVSHFTDWD